MDWFHKTMIAVSAAVGIAISGWAGYKIHESTYIPQITINESGENIQLRDQYEESQKKIKGLENDVLELQRDVIHANTNTAWAEQREAIAKKDKDMKPYELEKQNAELQAKVTILQGENSAYSAREGALKSRHEADLAKKDTEISRLEAQAAVRDAREEWIKASYETVISRERTSNATLQRRLIDNGIEVKNGYSNGYTVPTSRN